MPFMESELGQTASTRYSVVVIGGDAVFLNDHKLGHKLYMGSGRALMRSEFRRYVSALNADLRHLPIRDFLAKYGLHG